MKKALALIAVGLTLSLSCHPNISSIDPTSGPERTIVQVHGGTIFASLKWNAGTGSETTLTGAFLGAAFFTVPASSTLGAHNVQLEYNGSRGNIVPFTVTASPGFTAPRCDRISIMYAQFNPGNLVNTWLYVQGTNADVGAEVLIGGLVQPTAAVKVMREDLLGMPPADLAFPAYHHVAFLVAPGNLATGSTISVSIRNIDGLVSNAVSYTMPVDNATIDSDGDDLPDTWEKNGYDANGDGVIDIDLPALGADPHRPDIFVECDVMNGLANVPGAAVWTASQTMFSNAPILNPADADGINLHIDATGTVPHHALVSMTLGDDAGVDRANFYTLKNANFNNAIRGRIYQYCIWGDMQPVGYSGISDPHINAAGTDFDGPGDDFLVSFDDFPASYQTIRSMAETFVHELGHNLLQRHGGENHFQYNPVYSSIMSYSWQLRTGLFAATRLDRPVYFPFYYGQTGVVEVAGALPAAPGTLIDYSSGMGRNLVEGHLNETVGLFGGHAIDWNGDGDAIDVDTSGDINDDGDTMDTWHDYDNWDALVFSGPRLNGAHGN
jgi:hypothetical protein